MVEKITSATKKIMQQAYAEKVQLAQGQSLELGKLMEEQDGWHSEAAQRMEEFASLTDKMAVDIAAQLKASEVIDAPNQNEVIELGHMVKTNFLDDEDVKEYARQHVIPLEDIVTVVHLLSTLDKQYLPRKVGLDGVTEIIVSDESFLGKAIIGAKRGDIVRYGVAGMRVRIIDEADAIAASRLLIFEPDDNKQKEDT